MPLPDNYDIDRVFKLAGFPYGRPTETRPDNYIESNGNNWDALVNIFDDAQIDYIIDRVVSHSVDIPLIAGDNPVFDHLLAAELLQAVTDANLTPVGRAFDVTQISLGDVIENFDDAVAVRTRQSRTIATLRQRAIGLSGRIPSRRVSTEFSDSGINPAHIERRDITFENISVESGQTIETDLAELNAGGYLGYLSFDFVINGSNQFVVYIDNVTEGVSPFNERIYTSSNPFASVTDTSPLKRQSIPILARGDSEFKIGFQLFGSGATLAITNLTLQLYPLWGIAATQDQRVPEIPTDDDLHILTAKDSEASWETDNNFLTEILTTLFQNEFLGKRLLPSGASNTERQLIENNLGTLEWISLDDVLEQELYEEFSQNEIPSGGEVVVVGDVDTTANEVTIKAVAKLPIDNLADAVVARLTPTPLGDVGDTLQVGGSSSAKTVEWGDPPPAIVGANSVGFDQLKEAIQKRLTAPITSSSRGYLALDASQNPVWFPITLPPPALSTNRGQVLTAIEDPNDSAKTIPSWVAITLPNGSVGLAELSSDVIARIAPSLTGNGGKFLAVNSGATAVELIDAPTPSVANNSITLDKLASSVLARIAPSLTGNGGKFLAINSGATAVELVDKPTSAFPTSFTLTRILSAGFIRSNSEQSFTASENIVSNAMYVVISNDNLGIFFGGWSDINLTLPNFTASSTASTPYLEVETTAGSSTIKITKHNTSATSVRPFIFKVG